MAVGLLTHVGAEARRRLSREPQDGGVEPLFCLHRDALRVVATLREALPPQPAAYQHSAYAACAAPAMNCYFVAAPIRTERGTTVPVPALPLLDSRDKQLDYIFSAVAATLDLFDSMTPEWQV
ncbi:uncharacterized protein Tco025E_08077, partial [Trypanosoma conorhini]